MNIPNDYLCPITLEIMNIPVILIEDGRSYEKTALERWLINNNTSPMTNKVLKSKEFIINISLKNAIEEFREKQTKSQHYQEVSTALEIKTGALPQKFKDKKYCQLLIKICLLGDRYVGKTSILKYLQFQDQISNKVYAATVGPDMATLHLNRLFKNRYAVSIVLFDLPGETKWRDLWKSQYQCHGAILVCDVTNPKTLRNIEESWYPALKEYGYDIFEGVTLCNKSDLTEDLKDEIYKDAEQFSIRNNMPLFYTSAITGKNVQIMFNQLVLSILNNNVLVNRLKESVNIVLKSKHKEEPRKEKTGRNSCC
ncbi:unnamed protein product [Rotaria magnacalcarata]|uniref:U-box domain-containing protein n=2 Tax=Rotaria magnacalcarata TaxID=392030 RepID=A0A814WRJ9_9BILA|nr:unnamed protein product [Rotaria magnacalcarata]CAF1553858.1 unnamed protein product [Rotaria magnacalcarata]CAF4955519.1 unnamed protein product [Rotaria magnacalcarata]